MIEWKSQKLGAIADMCLGKMLDKEKNKGEPHPYLGNINVRWGGFDLDNLNQMRFEADEHERYGLQAGDLVICEGGEPGRCALWRGQVPDMKIQKALHRVRVKNSHDAEFVFYRFLLARETGELEKHFIGSTIKHLTGLGLREVEFEYPPKPIQKRIAGVLSALDAKIELNNQINAELEAMAKLLYDYWFVQFDFPMTAAQAATLGRPALEGHPYKSSGGKMVHNPTLNRQIPAGWEPSTVGETFKTDLGGTPSKKIAEYWQPAEVNWLSSGEKDDIFVLSSDEKLSELGLKNSAAKLLPKGTVILSIVRHLRASILGVPAATNQSVVGIRETSKLKACFIYPYLLREIPRLMTLRTGAQQPHINKGVVDNSPLVLPESDVLAAYSRLSAPLFEQMENHQKQNQELTQLRDWLLPMLMNGQVTVR